MWMRMKRLGTGRAAAVVGFAAMVGWLALPACGDQFQSEAGHGGAGGSLATGGTAVGGSGAATTSSSAGGGGAPCSDYGNLCYGCAVTDCTDLYCGCVNDPACLALAICVGGCSPTNNPSCLQPCYAQHPDAVSQSALLSDCMGTACQGSCPGYEPLTPCRLCLFSNCAAAMNACLANADCTQILFCSEACGPGDTVCVTGCNTAHPGGQVLAADVASCIAQHCGSQCPWGTAPSADAG
jgi:hypothetical protein